jgi:hypothetical protein
MPADVVRFHGLDKMMELRDEAKMGLKRMEAMGQMGNADEATLPDDVPFGMDDLDMDDEPTEMAEGGIVQAANGTFMSPNTGIGGFQQSQFANYTPQFTSYVPTQLPTTSYIAPQQQTTPLASQQTLPKFEDVIPAPEGKYDEIIEYENEEGLKLSIPFVNGKPIFPIPKGDDGGDDPRPTVVETATLGNTKYNIGYTSSDPIGLPGILGGIATAVSGRNDQVTLTNPSTKEKATISKQTFDSLKGQSGSQVNSFLGNVFNAQKAVDFNKDRIAQNFPVRSAVKDVGAAFGIGQSFGTPIDQQTAAAKEIAKDMNIDYNGQSLAEMIAMSIADKDKTTTATSRTDVLKSKPGQRSMMQQYYDKQLDLSRVTPAIEQPPLTLEPAVATRGVTRGVTRDPSRGLSPGALGGRDVYGYGSMTQSTDDEAADIAGAGAGAPQATMSPQEAQQKGIEMGFESHTVAPGTATNEAIAQAENQGDKAAPAGSQYSANGKFSSPEREPSGGGSDSSSCFIKGTKVTLHNGKKRSIEKLKKGDLVLGVNGITNKVLGLEEILSNEDTILVKPEGYKNYFITNNHPFYHKGKLVSYNAKRNNQYNPWLGNVLDAKKYVKHKEKVANKKQIVYNIYLDGDHTFYANGLPTHNIVTNGFISFALLYSKYISNDDYIHDIEYTQGVSNRLIRLGYFKLAYPIAYQIMEQTTFGKICAFVCKPFVTMTSSIAQKKKSSNIIKAIGYSIVYPMFYLRGLFESIRIKNDRRILSSN